MDIEGIESILESLENYTTPCSDIAVKLGEVRDFITQLKTENERLKSDKWISADDRLPEMDVDVLCFCKCVDNTTYHSIDSLIYADTWANNFNNVTHWQPLPVEPKENK